MRSFTLAAGLAFSTALACLAAEPTLNIQTGLWEVTSVGETSGTPPIPAETLARLTPQQRAQFEASMKAAMDASSKPDVRRSCITQKTLERGLDMSEKERGSCKRTVVASSSSLMDVRMECTGSEKMTGTLHFEAVNRQTMHGNINMVVTDGTNNMTIKRTMDGKWIGADCGSVRPEE